jgi:hypothetical protein
MPRNRFFFIMLFACAGAVWIYNASLMTNIMAPSVKRSPDGAPVRGDEALSGTSRLVDSALGLRPVVASVRFGGGFESPFKAVSEARQAASVASAGGPAQASRPRIVLKGILYKSNPLAILETAGAATSILGIGDTLLGQTVTAISKTSVTLKDKRGAYKLSVKE